MTDDERAMLGSEIRRRAALAPPSGVPMIGDIEPDTGEVTSPIQLLLPEDVAPDAHERAVDRLRRDSRDPYALIYNLAEALTKKKRDDLSANKARADQLLEILDRAPNKAAIDLQDDVAALRRDAASRSSWRRWLMGIAGAVLVAALGALGTGIGLMRSSAEQEGETKIRLMRLEQDVQQLLHDERAQRRTSPAPSRAHDPQGTVQ